MDIDTQWEIGVNCGTTAALNVLKHWGYSFSEPLLFGLGKGLGFTYYADSTLPYPFVSGRGNHLYENIMNSLGFDTEIYGGDHGQIRNIFQRLEEGQPSVVLLDLNKLDYITNNLPKMDDPYLYSEHHAIVVGGDEKENYILLKDHLWPVMRLDVPDFESAWGADYIIPKPLIQYYYKDSIKKNMLDESKLKQSILFAIYRNFHELKFPCNPTNNVSGVRGMKSFLNDMTNFSAKFAGEDRGSILFNMLISIEKLGTGGGNFRRFYSKFLRDAFRITGVEFLQEFSQTYNGLSEKWKLFNRSMEKKTKERVDNLEPSDLELLREIIETEVETIDKLYPLIEKEIA